MKSVLALVAILFSSIQGAQATIYLTDDAADLQLAIRDAIDNNVVVRAKSNTQLEPDVFKHTYYCRGYVHIGRLGSSTTGSGPYTTYNVSRGIGYRDAGDPQKGLVTYTTNTENQLPVLKPPMGKRIRVVHGTYFGSNSWLKVYAPGFPPPTNWPQNWPPQSWGATLGGNHAIYAVDLKQVSNGKLRDIPAGWPLPNPESDLHNSDAGSGGDARQPLVASLDYKRPSDTGWTLGAQMHWSSTTILNSGNNPWYFSYEDALYPAGGDEFWIEGGDPLIANFNEPLPNAGFPWSRRAVVYPEQDYAPINIGVQYMLTYFGPHALVHLADNPFKTDPDDLFDRKQRYKIINSPDLLREPGQMAYDIKSGWLFFIPFTTPPENNSGEPEHRLNISFPGLTRNPATSGLPIEDTSDSPYGRRDQVARAPIELNLNQALKITGFDFDTCLNWGIYADRVTGLVIDDCTFQNVGQAGVQINRAESTPPKSLTSPTVSHPELRTQVVNCTFRNGYKGLLDISDARWEFQWPEPSHTIWQAFACLNESKVLVMNNTFEVGGVGPAEPSWITAQKMPGGSNKLLRSSGQLYSDHRTIRLRGHSVGASILQNLIKDAAGQAINFNGYGNLIQDNTIIGACRDATDAGAIGTGLGPDTGLLDVRNDVKNNLIAEVRKNYGGYQNLSLVADKPAAIQLDDATCGQNIALNIFSECDLAIKMNGGRFHLIDQNQYLNCTDFLQWSKYWASDSFIQLINRPTARVFGTQPFGEPLPNQTTVLTMDNFPWNGYASGSAYQFFPAENDLREVLYAQTSGSSPDWTTWRNQRDSNQTTVSFLDNKSDRFLARHDNASITGRLLLSAFNVVRYRTSDFVNSPNGPGALSQFNTLLPWKVVDYKKWPTGLITVNNHTVVWANQLENGGTMPNQGPGPIQAPPPTPVGP